MFPALEWVMFITLIAYTIIHSHQLAIVIIADPTRAMFFMWPVVMYLTWTVVRIPLDWVLSDLHYQGNFSKYKCIAYAVVFASLKMFVDYGNEREGPPLEENLQHRVAVITGATTHIGWAVAKDLIHRGAEVILGTDDLQTCNSRLADIATTQGQTQCIQVNWHDMYSVQRFAADINGRHQYIDYLFNNEGQIMTDTNSTDQGYEVQLGNHFGHHLLTMSLLNPLSTPNPYYPDLDSRVVYTGSVAMWASGSLHPSVNDPDGDGEGDLRGEYLANCRFPVIGKVHNHYVCMLAGIFTGIPWSFGRAKLWSFASAQRFETLERLNKLEDGVQRWKTKPSNIKQRHIKFIVVTPGAVAKLHSVYLLPPFIGRPAHNSKDVMLFAALSDLVTSGDFIDEHHHIHKMHDFYTIDGLSLPSVGYASIVGFSRDQMHAAESRIWKVSTKQIEPFL
eukprot:gene1199-723_t